MRRNLFRRAQTSRNGLTEWRFVLLKLQLVSKGSAWADAFTTGCAVHRPLTEAAASTGYGKGSCSLDNTIRIPFDILMRVVTDSIRISNEQRSEVLQGTLDLRIEHAERVHSHAIGPDRNKSARPLLQHHGGHALPRPCRQCSKEIRDEISFAGMVAAVE